MKTIIKLKLEYLWKQYRIFEKVGNKTAMRDYECMIDILEDVLECAEENEIEINKK